ncbi:hypothetical protein AB6N24_09985 [Cellulomonas sp. 179-A 4D5 NHS]|uniref:hypothetical protein n=1 Tax=Cellulomonas sp. 179-A 4D5 NHS TaxID=3142378 RepID=UPI0039A01246
MSPDETLARPEPGSDLRHSPGARGHGRRWAVLAGAVLGMIALTGVVVDFREDDRVRHERIAELLHPPYDGS